MNPFCAPSKKLMGVEVIRPDVSGLMGAYGMALLAAETAEELQKGNSTLLDSEGLNSLQVATTMRQLRTLLQQLYADNQRILRWSYVRDGQPL